MQAILIAGTHSGCGKTTMTLGILAALRKKGLTVQPFKAGPDFIDSGLHRLAVDRPSRNLDLWMCGREYVTGCFKRYASCADIAVIEGVMGMHDGEFSSAELARLLQAPVLLVVDAYGMAESAGAIVQGFVEFGVRSVSQSAIRNPKSEIKFAGVIFNRVASESHYKRLKDSVRDVPVLGYLPRELDFEIPHRHLGLATAEENPLAGGNIQKLADTVLSHIDIDAIIRQAGDGRTGYHREEHASIRNPFTPALTSVLRECRVQSAHPALACPHVNAGARFRIAVAYDKAFSFYYEDNLDLLRDAGADILRFSPIADPGVPDGVDAVYIGGGYPELHAEALARNTSMLSSVRAWAEAGRPLYAECGGLMYLSQGILGFDDHFFAMTGVFPFKTRMMKKPRLAYREIVLNKDCILGSQGQECRGHEFHYSDILQGTAVPDEGQGAKLYSVRDKDGLNAPGEGFSMKNTLASYIHVHFGSNLGIAERFAEFVKRLR
jgi:cobyrinic acid a,c-diamide synthase